MNLISASFHLCLMSVTLHINQHAQRSENEHEILYAYQEYFEDLFLQETQEFYQMEATKYMQQHSTTDYILKVRPNLYIN